MSRSLAAALVRLLEASGDAPASLFTEAQKKALDELGRRTGALAARPQGRGVVYRVTHRAALESVLRTMRPDAQSALPEGLPRRAANVATHRDSKARDAGHAFHYLLLKAIGEDVCWRHGPDRTLALSPVTAAAGAGVLAIRPDDSWRSDEPLWLVENQALFDRTDWLPAGTRASLAYYGGQIPARLLAWLARGRRAPELIVFADYDGVGLQNYARLLECSRAPCAFWLMPSWQELLRRYGSQAIWRDNHVAFMAASARLAELGAPGEVLALCRSMSREGLALEQEAVWHAPSAGQAAD